MIGVITRINHRAQRGRIAAPYLPHAVKLNRRDFQTDAPFDSRLVGRTVTFDLIGDEAVNVWLASCDFMAVAADNIAAVAETNAPSRQVGQATGLPALPQRRGGALQLYQN